MPFQFIHVQPAPRPNNETFSQSITRVGITSGLKLCLDAADSSSAASSTPDKWLDVSGNGYDFYRGSGTGSDAADPTFNGTVGGKSQNEYWSSDGGDYFTYDTTSETWMDNLHKDSAVWGFAGWMYVPSTAAFSPSLILTRAGGDAGVIVSLNKTALYATVTVYKATGAVFSQNSAAVLRLNGWNYVSFAINEATPAHYFNLNGVASSGAAAYAAPSTSGAGTPMMLMVTNSITGASSGVRIASLAMWEGTVPTAANLQGLFEYSGARF